MCFKISSLYPPYWNQSNSSNLNEEIEIRQPLVNTTYDIDTEQNRRSSTTIDPLLSYIEEQMDSKGHIECGLSVFSFVASVAILGLHTLEQYHDNHKEILTAQILNISILTFVYTRRILSCSHSSMSWAKKAVKWWRSNRSSEEDIEANHSSITQQPTGYFSSAIQSLKHLENLDNRLYFGLQIGCYLIFLQSLYLHIVEKEHENHEKLLLLEAINVAYSFALTVIQVKKTRAQNRIQPNSLSLSPVQTRGYQTI